MKISVPNVVLNDDPYLDVHFRFSSLRDNLGLVFCGFQVNIAELILYVRVSNPYGGFIRDSESYSMIIIILIQC